MGVLYLDREGDPDQWYEDSTGHWVRPVVMVDKDGTRWPGVLVDDAPSVEVDGELMDVWTRCFDCPPAHEEVGPLPAEVRRKLFGTCRGTTSKGKRCSRLPGPNGYCGSHDPERICGQPTKSGRPCHMPKGRCFHREART